MNYKIVKDREPICGKCKHGMLAKTSTRSFVNCWRASDTGRSLPYGVVECTGYEDKNSQSIWDFQQIAWQIRTDKSGKIVGFTPPVKEGGQA